MNMEKLLVSLGRKSQMSPREEMIRKTLERSEEIFLKCEEGRLLTYGEFLLSQMRVIRKRWWLLQLGLLLLLWSCLPMTEESASYKRVMGVVACVFVILMIPELWKNRASRSMEIEASAYYSLRKVYAARMTLFGVADIILAGAFCAVTSATLHVALMDILTQFFFPLMVTACICFALLCSSRLFSETSAVIMCVIWCGVWLTLVLRDDIFYAVSLPLWGALFLAAALFLAFVLHRAVTDCGSYWEVNVNGTENK